MESQEPKKDAGTPETKPVVEQATQPAMAQTTSKGKKLSWKKILFVVLAVVILVLIILILTNVINLKTLKTNSGSSKEIFNVSYSMYGPELIDSGNQAFTKDTISTTLGLVSGQLDQEVDKMSVGEEKNITLEAKDAFGARDPSLVFNYERVSTQDRINTINKTMWITTSVFTQTFSEQPILGQTYNLSQMPWPYKVIDLNSTNVELEQEATLNQEIPYGLFTLRVMEINDKEIKLKMFGNDTIVPTANGNYIVNFTATEIITTLEPQIGQEITLTGLPKAIVTGMNSTDVFLDANDPNAGKTITVDVKLVDKKTEKTTGTTGSAIKHIDGAPTMQVFIMSHCPYGTQMVKGLLPVWRAFNGKANIELRFVSYTMHGAQEDLDNNRIMCIREEQSSKLIDYLDCYVHADGTEAGAQSCISKVNIDKTKLDSCVTNSAATYYAVDKQLNTQYSVQGSPTVIIDGKEASVYPRDPATVAKALCDAFTGTKPAECSQAFSTTNPAAGFGPDGTSGSSGTNSSCG